MQFCDLQAQYRRLAPTIQQRIASVLEHGQFIMGPEVAELEQKLAAFAGVKHAVAVSSGTDALLVALMALEIAPGDEVITTAFSFIATAETIALLGARPVFVDIDRSTYNIDPRAIEAALTPRTKAIIPVSLYGQCAEMDAINALAAAHGVPVIEDAAQSFGATYDGRRSCALSAIGCTSFFPAKPLGGYGDGGACFTDDDALAQRMRQVRNHGQDRRYHHPLVGINGRLDTLQAAILLAKLEVFADEIEARSRLGARYTEMLSAAGARSVAEAETGLLTPYLAPQRTSVYAQYTIQVDAREQVAEKLKARGIPTAVHYPRPLNEQPAFARHVEGAAKTPHSQRAASRVLSLPMHPYLEDSEQVRVVEAVAEATR